MLADIPHMTRQQITYFSESIFFSLIATNDTIDILNTKHYKMRHK